MKRASGSHAAILCALSAFSGVAAAQQPAPPPDDSWTTEPAPAPPPPPAPAAAAPQPGPPPLAPTPLAPSAAPAPGAPPAGTAAPGAVPPKPKKESEYTGPATLIGGKQKPKIGGYGGLSLAYSHMLHKDGVLIGGEGAVLIDHRLSLGFAGYGFSRTPSGPPTATGIPREFGTGYGGFVARYSLFVPDFPVYLSLGVLLGGGAVILATEQDWDGDDCYDGCNDDEWAEEVHAYYVTQPEVSIHTNVTRWLRFGFNVGYRFAGEIDDGDFGNDALSGILVGGSFHAGWL